MMFSDLCYHGKQPANQSAMTLQKKILLHKLVPTQPHEKTCTILTIQHLEQCAPKQFSVVLNNFISTYIFLISNKLYIN